MTTSKENSFSEWVCAMCDNGGELLSCRGKCLRSFHATPDPELGCETLKFTGKQVEEMKFFLCDNCLYKKHQCYACGILGSSAMSNQEVFICGSSDCGLHYHPYCVSKLLYYRDGAKAAQLANDIKEGVGFNCPRHLCHICRGREDKTIRELQFAICRRCPISYHRQCLPSEIIFEDRDKDILQRAWEDLLDKRILIYCMKHNIEKNLGTPMRNHLQFPPVQRSKMTAKDRYISRVKEISNSNDQSPPKKKHRIARSHVPTVLASGEKQKHVVSASKADARLPRSSFPQISEETENKMRAFLEESPSLTIEKVREKFKMPSTHCNSHKQIIESFSEEEVKEDVESVRAASAKLLTPDGTIEEAKAICHPATLVKLIDRRTKLKVYLAPFILGSRYTSFGRHFTKVDKLAKIVDKLHLYVQDGDTVVDFCCGSNDFSILMRDKLASLGKKCLFRNFDLQQPKNDFNFEKRDWMTVEPEELPEGDRLIMGLNPPFGVKAALANKFINQALKFKPKILILIVPRETKRMDRTNEYSLIWHDPCMLSGKSFYLPGSLDNEHKEVEQWNLKAPPLYFWSRQDWVPLHREIANKHGHLSEEDYLTDKVVDTKNKANPEDDKEYHDFYKQNQDLFVEEAGVAELPSLPPLAVPPFMETHGNIDTKGDEGSLSDMSISSPESNVKSYLRGEDHGFNAGLGAGSSMNPFGNYGREVGPSNPLDYYGSSSLRGEDDGFNAGLGAGSSMKPFGNYGRQVGPSNPPDYYGSLGFGGWFGNYWMDGK